MVLLLAIGSLFLQGILVPSSVTAQYTSPNYRIEETFTGSGGELDPSSPSYKAQQSAGSLAVGFTSGTAYKAYTGFLTPNEPFLELVIGTTTVNLGTLSSSSASTGTAFFYVRCYVNSSYSVVTVSDPPKTSGGRFLTNLTSATASSPGTEQFGMNLVLNSSPSSFGADPLQNPDNSFANGIASAGYNATNLYKYVKGDTVAQSSGSGWGETDYTISYIANINPISPAGNYSMVHDLVILATY